MRVGGFDSFLFAAPDFAGSAAGGDWFAGAAGFADPRVDPACEEFLVECLGVVAAVGPKLLGDQAPFGECVEEGQEVALFVFVAGAEPDLER